MPSPRFCRRRFVLASAAALAGPRAWAGARWKVGYAALTWGDENAKVALADIAAAGFRGVQLRKPGLAAFASPAALAAELGKHKLAFACLSGGAVGADPARRAAEIAAFMTGATFAKAAGAKLLQVVSPKRTANATPDEVKAFAATLDELGKQTAALGVPLAWHPSADQFGRTAAEVDAVMKATDPKRVKLLLDTGHHAAAGGDPARAIKDHAGRLAMVHLKDMKPVPKGNDPFEFVELGQGTIDFRAVGAALDDIGFSGWAVVEMRPYSVKEGHSARDGARANRAFLEKLGVRL